MAYHISRIISYNDRMVCYWHGDRQMNGIEWRTQTHTHMDAWHMTKVVFRITGEKYSDNDARVNDYPYCKKWN